MKTVMMIAVVACVACAGNEPGGPDAVLSVGGTYATAVALESNTCTGITVQPNPTTVTHSPGATSLTLAHAGLSYTGTIASDARFTTTPRAVSGGGATHTLTITGQFATRGFDALVAVTVTSSGAPCEYRVRWTGTKQGADNVIP